MDLHLFRVDCGVECITGAICLETGGAVVCHLLKPCELLLHAERLEDFVEIPVAVVGSGEAALDRDYAPRSWHLE
jgi:hypothetical protein